MKADDVSMRNWSACLPAPRPLTTGRLIRGVVIWVGLAVALLLLLRYDLTLMQWRCLWLSEEPTGEFRRWIQTLRDFGQPPPMIIVSIAILLVDRRRWLFVAMLIVAQLAAAVVYNPVKWYVPRYRPPAFIAEVARSGTTDEDLGAEAGDEALYGPEYAELFGARRPEQTWLFGQPRNRATRYESFPSGHSAGAFVFATVLAWFYPRLRWLVFALAAGCAASRFVNGVHWASDCLAGAMVGYCAAWLTLRPYVWPLAGRWMGGKSRSALKS